MIDNLFFRTSIYLINTCWLYNVQKSEWDNQNQFDTELGITSTKTEKKTISTTGSDFVFFCQNGLCHPIQHSYILLPSFKGLEFVKELDGTFQGSLQDIWGREKWRTRTNSKLCDHIRGPRGLLRRGDR